MTSKKIDREQIIRDINEAGRKMSMATIFFHQTVAEKAGLSGTDHKYLDLLFQEGAMPAGRLAELTGLTTGAITGIVDRLEKQGMVKRENDPDDRRKVLVVPQVEKAMKKLAPIFESLQEDLESFYGKYSDEELLFIRKFLSETNDFFHDKTSELRSDSSS